MVQKLKEGGVEKTKEQMLKKMQKLRDEYRKQKPGPTGASPSNWPYYGQMKQLLRSSHYFNPSLASTNESEVPSVNGSHPDGDDDSEESLTVASTPTTSSSVSESGDAEKLLKPKKRKSIVDELNAQRNDLKAHLEDLKQQRSSFQKETKERSERLEQKFDTVSSKMTVFMDFMMNKMQSQAAFGPSYQHHVAGSSGYTQDTFNASSRYSSTEQDQEQYNYYPNSQGIYHHM